MNEIGTVPATLPASTGWPGMEGSRKENIMAHFNVESLKSYAIAGVASLYCSLMFLAAVGPNAAHFGGLRSEEHTSELQSLMSISYAVFCLKKKTTHIRKNEQRNTSMVNKTRKPLYK